jgi:hypothetical protein
MRLREGLALRGELPELTKLHHALLGSLETDLG